MINRRSLCAGAQCCAGAPIAHQRSHRALTGWRGRRAPRDRDTPPDRATPRTSTDRGSVARLGRAPTLTGMPVPRARPPAKPPAGY